jgi:aspartyl-tRNA(Asn)/glutamyl-tRNA(Gln) amidotransferase subunit B
MSASYEVVIGLEVHAQLKTRTKIFCGCPTTFGAAPNSQVCSVCLGHPGALPVLNRRAVELAVRGALALGCEVQDRSIFARKNYFYPDLPKGYQISQFAEPLATGGGVTIETDAGDRTIGLIRLHLEEDAGKSIHDGMSDSDEASYVDLNRSGMPLVEIVSLPDVRSADESYRFLQRLKSILRYTDVCDGNMEEGSLRCDANVSLRPAGQRELGTRTELKNLNSFRNVRRALEYEIERQASVLNGGGKVVQQTVMWDAAANRTRPMRGKEEAHDYRYFPEPDLRPLILERSWITQQHEAVPELPGARKRRLMERDGLTAYEADILTLEAPLADYYERVVAISSNPKGSSNWILNDLLREQKAAGKDESEIPVSPENLAELIGLVENGTISPTVARQELFEPMYHSGKSPGELVREKGLEQVSDENTLREMARAVLDEHPGQRRLYEEGKRGLLGFFVGQVMKASRGKANPEKVNDLLREMLDDDS